MHRNVKIGNRLHKQHFDAIRASGWLAPGWEIWCVNGALGTSRLRPDWVLVNATRREAIVVDLTSKYHPAHYRKGLKYRDEVIRMLDDPTWNVVYLEDYWLNATVH